jgi:hypothetical protein
MSRQTPRSPDRSEIERQGNLVFWMTLGAGLLVVLGSIVLAVTL